MSAASSATHKAIVLYSSVPSNAKVEGDQRALLQLLDGKKITYELIDGANAQNRDARAALWEVSGKRAIYPQLFAKHAESGVHDFIGDWAAIFELVESNEVTHGLDAALASLATSGPVAEVK